MSEYGDTSANVASRTLPVTASRDSIAGTPGLSSRGHTTATHAPMATRPALYLVAAASPAKSPTSAKLRNRKSSAAFTANKNATVMKNVIGTSTVAKRESRACR